MPHPLEELFPLIESGFRTFWSRYGPAAEQVADEAGLEVDERRLLLAAILAAPEPISTATLARSYVYSAPTLFESALESAAAKGYLAPADDGYRLTEQGRAVIERWIEAARQAMVPLIPLPQPELERLAALTHRLVEAALAVTNPDPFHLRRSRVIDPGPDAPVMMRIDQYLTDLSAFRDDCHIAAWRGAGFDGPTIEALTLLWRKEQSTLDGIGEVLAHRGHPPQVYADAVAHLREPGYVTGPDDAPTVTAEGRTARQGVEEETDRLFYAPWGCLDEGELADLRDLLTRFRDGLEAEQPPEEPA